MGLNFKDFMSQIATDSSEDAKFSAEDIQSVVDEVIWVVGDEAILKSDVEAMRIQAQQEGVRWKGDPDCAIPEQIAVQKLYLHQAAIDSIDIVVQNIAEEKEYKKQLAREKRKQARLAKENAENEA